jgi:hypothetical protein
MGAGTGPLQGKQVFRMIVEFVDPTSLANKPLPASMYTQFETSLNNLLQTLPNPGKWTPKESTPPVSQGEILLRAILTPDEADTFNCSLDDVLRGVRVWDSLKTTAWAAIVKKNIGPAASEGDPNHGQETGPGPLCEGPGHLTLKEGRGR